jgi:hypothetical protein
MLHRLTKKVGNNERALQPGHLMYSEEALNMFTSDEAKSKGVHYLNREVQTVAYYTTKDGTKLPIRVYGNPMQPEYSYSTWVGTRGQGSFNYPPQPSPEATQAWSNAPSRSDEIPIWVMHGPPLGRLDLSRATWLIGCAVQAEKVEAARPMLCVFGHLHYSHGVERVQWNEDGGVSKAEILVMSAERRAERGGPPRIEHELDFTGDGAFDRLKKGSETVFVNAAWKTDSKDKDERNRPVIFVTLKME